MTAQPMKPIWYFVGLILLIIGGIIVLTGVYELINPPLVKTKLAELHPNLWWGALMMIFGSVLFLKTRKGIA